MGCFIIGLPFFYSFARQKAIIRKHIDEDSQKLLELLDKEDILQVQSTFVYEKKKNTV